MRDFISPTKEYEMDVATIGFTKKSAEKFFGLLSQADVRALLDVRVNDTWQLAGFAKKPDLGTATCFTGKTSRSAKGLSV
jgi:hypothetical protein